MCVLRPIYIYLHGNIKISSSNETYIISLLLYILFHKINILSPRIFLQLLFEYRKSYLICTYIVIMISFFFSYKIEMRYT